MAVTAINASRRSDVTRTLDTVEVGKAEVEKNDSGFGFGDVDEGGCAGAAPGGGIAVALEAELKVLPNGGVVFDDQHCRERGWVGPAHAGEPTGMSGVSCHCAK
jgi:hypothetical protein